jgi:ribosomal protein L20A (L18A)
MERYKIGGRQKVRSSEVQILKVESSVLKKKREYEREEGE